MDLLQTLLRLFLFPGLLFALFMAFLLAGLDRKLVARMQRRVGPPLLQPWYDFLKCLGKETIVPRKASRQIFLAAPFLGECSLLVTALFLPVGGRAAFSGVADTVVVLYLLTFASVMLMMGASASGSPFAGVGLSREMVAMISYELPLVLVLLAVGRAAGGAGALGVTFSLTEIADAQAANGPLLLRLSLLPAALAMLLVIPCEVGQQPFDVDEAETEICEGALAEYSGRPLAQFKLMHNLKMYVLSALFCVLFLNVQTGNALLDIAIFVAATVVVTFVSMSLPHAVSARFRTEQVFKFYWTWVSGLAALSLCLVWLGL